MSAPGRSSGSHADALRIAVRCENLKELQQSGIGEGGPRQGGRAPRRGKARYRIRLACVAADTTASIPSVSMHDPAAVADP